MILNFSFMKTVALVNDTPLFFAKKAMISRLRLIYSVLFFMFALKSVKHGT